MPYYDFYESPRGRMLLVADDQALIGVYFFGQKYQPRIEGDWIRNTRHALLRQVKRELAEYFGGTRTHFTIKMAPHGTANGLLGLGALINVCATLPANFIAFEYPSASDPWWNDIVIGLPERIVIDSHVDLLPAPGLGLDIDAEAAKKYLADEDIGFFLP